jgi:putative ABC transport system ATP-binding protein
MPHGDIVLEAENVVKTYTMGEAKVHAVNGISVKIRKGEFVSIMGPSGSGKTTLLDILSCLLRPTAGEVFIKGKAISKMDDAELARIRGRTIGFVFQSFNLIPRMSALENVMLPLWFNDIDASERQGLAMKNLQKVGLGQRLHHTPNQLSGGEMQRVAIARALAVNPEIIVADEPTGNLDSVSGKQVLEIIKGLHEKEGKTVVMVTHDLKVGEMAERMVKLHDGKVCSSECLARLKKSRKEAN